MSTFKGATALAAALTMALAAGSVRAETADWSGWYAGGTLSGAQHTSSWTDVDYWYYGGTQGTARTGFMYGVSGGYGWQNGSTVMGVELSMDFSSMERELVYSGGDVRKTDALNSLLMIRGRYGIAVDKTLFYLTGGLGRVDAEHSWVDIATPGANDFQVDNTKLGYSFGFGIEHRMTDLLSLKAEFVQTRVAEESDVNGVDFEMRVAEAIDALRVGVNYQF